MGRILVGTCNWADHTNFYPRGIKPTDRLAYYAQFFPIVEIDASFYGLMPARNYELWAERTPDDFVFNVKAYRTLTKHGEKFVPGKKHDTDAPELDPSEEDFKAFGESIKPLKQAGKLRAIHFQFPPWFKATDRNREYLNTVREYFPDDLLAIEFRHMSWAEGQEQVERTMTQLEQLGVAYTIVDQPQIGSASVPPIVDVTTKKLSIVRFHGRNYKTWYIKNAKHSDERFDYLYPKEVLADWVPTIDRLAEAAEEVHVMMNNNRGNYAVVNARDVQLLLGQEPKLGEIEPESDRAKQAKLPLGD